MATVIRPELTAEQLLEDYRQHRLRQTGSRSMATANWLTVLSHPCEAYGAYNRLVRPEDRLPMPASLAMVFGEGRAHQREFEMDLRAMGYEVTGGEGQLAWPNFQITAKRDFILTKGGSERKRAEFKSVSPYLFDKINTPADLRNHKSYFIKKWYDQVVGLMVLENVPDYWMIAKNKSNGQIRILEFHLEDEELDAGEGLLKKAERINQHVASGKVPLESKISDPDICSGCEFFNVCLPPLTLGPGAKVLDDAELAASLDRWQELRELAKEWDELDGEIKAHIKAVAQDGTEAVVVGDWVAKLTRYAVKEKVIKAYQAVRVSLSKVRRGD